MNVDEWLSSVNMDTLGVDDENDLVRTPSRTSIITDSSGVSIQCEKIGDMSRVMRKPTFWFCTWSDTNQAVQLQKMTRGLIFRI